MAGTRRRIEVEVLVDSSRVHTGFAQAAASTNQFVRGVERTSRGAVAGTVAITGMGRAIAFASAQFLGGYGLLYGLSAAVRSAISFQQAMVLIQTQAGGTAKEVAFMTNAVLKLAPAVGETPNELAKGLYHVESSGIRGAKALDTLRIAAEGAKLGGADLESVTSALVATQKSGIKGAQDLGQAMGALDAIIGTGNLRMEDLAHALSSGILTSARAFGVGLNDIGAALSTLTVQGVPAQLAATRLRTSLSFLAAGTPAAERALAQIGLTTHKLGETLRHSGMVPALELISQKLHASGLDATEQGAVLTRAFGGARTATTIITLLQNIDQVSKHLNAINVASHNFAAKWAAEQKTAQFATDRLKGSIVSFADQIGLSLLPTVDRVSNAVSKWMMNSQNQARVQRDLTQVVQIAKSVATDFYRVANFVADTLFGWHRAVELLIGLKLAAWIVNTGQAAFKAARYMWALATAEQAVAASSKSIAAASGISASGNVIASTGAGAAARRAALVDAQRAAVTRVAGDEGTQVFASKAVQAAAEREAAITAMQTGATGFGGAVMLRTAGGQREVLNPERLRLLQSQLGEDARVTEGVAPGFAGAVRPALFSGYPATPAGPADSAAAKYLADRGINPMVSSGEGFMATGAAFGGSLAKLEKPLGEVTPRFAGLIKMFPSLGTEITSVSGALGSAGLAGAAGFASYEMTSMALKATHLDGVLRRLGHGAADLLLGSGSGPAPSSSDDYQKLFKAAQKLVTNAGPGSVSSSIVPKLVSSGRGIRSIGSKIEESLNLQKIEVRLHNLFPNVSAKDIHQLVLDAQRQIEHKLKTEGLNVHAPRPTVSLSMLDQAKLNAPALGAPPIDAQTAATLALSKARLEAAMGTAGANNAIIAAQRQQIEIDKAGIKTQERLIKQHHGLASIHAALIAKLYDNEAAAFNDIKSIETSKKKDFALPMMLQVAQARAANTDSTTDDVAVAKQIVKFTQAGISSGKFKGLALVAAIQELGSAQDTIQSFNIPVKLALAQAWASTTATATDDIKVAQETKNLIMAQIKSGKLRGKGLLAAVGQLAGLNSTINNNFQVPMRLQLAAAKAATTSVTTDDRKVAQETKNFAEAYLKSKKRTSEGMLAAYNAITSANSTLGTTGVATAYEMPSAHKLTAGLNLPRAKRIELEQRYAQANSHDGRRPMAGMVGALGEPINVTVNINGDYVKAGKVTKTVQRDRRRTAPQTRGRNAGHGVGID